MRGHKYLDLDADARLDGGESGLAGVTIRLLDAEGRVIATTVSGSDGSYIFEGLRAGKYTVEEMVPDGYAATAPVAVAFTLALDEAKEVDFFNRVLVAGEIVTPPAPPAIAPEVQPGATQTLPVTGLDIGRLLVLIGLLILAGAFVASLGIARLAR